MDDENSEPQVVSVWNLAALEQIVARLRTDGVQPTHIRTTPLIARRIMFLAALDGVEPPLPVVADPGCPPNKFYVLPGPLTSDHEGDNDG